MRHVMVTTATVASLPVSRSSSFSCSASLPLLPSVAGPVTPVVGLSFIGVTVIVSAGVSASCGLWSAPCVAESVSSSTTSAMRTHRRRHRRLCGCRILLAVSGRRVSLACVLQERFAVRLYYVNGGVAPAATLGDLAVCISDSESQYQIQCEAYAR